MSFSPGELEPNGPGTLHKRRDKERRIQWWREDDIAEVDRFCSHRYDPGEFSVVLSPEGGRRGGGLLVCLLDVLVKASCESDFGCVGRCKHGGCGW